MSLCKKLEDHKKELEVVKIRDLFLKDPNRFHYFSKQLGDIVFDYSKQKITAETLKLLCALAETKGLSKQQKAMLAGENINFTEGRAVLHPLLRDFSSDSATSVLIKNALARLETFCENIRSGVSRSSEGLRFTDIVCLGIGGSDLGPSMACEALQAFKTTDIRLHFVSNVDGFTVAEVLKHLDPKRTLCVISSKTFTTPETLLNAKAVKDWLSNALEEKDLIKHLVGVTAHAERAKAFGISEDYIFEFWDFVGGRYSIWSAVGLPLAILIGPAQFRSFLSGANEVDKHFFSMPFEDNIPVLMALLEIWNVNFWHTKTQAIIPYDDRLKQFPAYLQQLSMESNGKRVTKEGKVVSYDTAPVLWGGVGCNGQHAYMQLLHQGTQIIPVDFLMAAKGHPDFKAHHDLLVASCLSQSKALMEGTTDSTLEKDPLSMHKFYPGDRPSNTILYSELTPALLGSLIALYEHKVFVEGVIWEINSFDQYGVELGKTITQKVLKDLDKPLKEIETDGSTFGLIKWLKQKSLTPTLSRRERE